MNRLFTCLLVVAACGDDSESATEDGAKGMEYMVHLRYGDEGQPNIVWGGGHYEDTYVKTPDGWRFKTRRFIPSQGTPDSLKPQTAGTR